MIPAPRSRSLLMRWKRCCVSSGVSEAVGSSKMNTFALWRTARTISTICRFAAPSVSTSARGSTLKFIDCSDWVAAMFILLYTVTNFSTPNSRFCATVIDGTRLDS